MTAARCSILRFCRLGNRPFMMQRKRKKPTIYGKGVAYEWLVRHVSYPGDNCLTWPFARDSRVGRGLLGHESRRYWAHRLMCILAHGEPPTPKHQASHTCGRGHEGCVNPRHLEWKTNSENQYDRGNRQDRRTTQAHRHHTRRNAGGRRRAPVRYSSPSHPSAARGAATP